MVFPVESLNGASDRATELFVESLAEREELAAQRLRDDIHNLKWHVNSLFVASIFAAMIALGLCVAGVVMIFLGQVGPAAVSEAMSILTGVGTAGLKSMGTETRDDRNQLIDEEREAARIMRAVGLCWMIPDPVQRNAAMADLAAKMARLIEQPDEGRNRKQGRRRRRGRTTDPAD
jgi:hypothetical protein